jgi:hypothetical protein
VLIAINETEINVEIIKAKHLFFKKVIIIVIYYMPFSYRRESSLLITHFVLSSSIQLELARYCSL